MWRRSTVANVVTLSDIEVYEITLPTRGILSAALLQLRATNGATSNLAASLAQCVSAIQVVDGGRLLCDLTGEQAQMVTLLGAGCAPRSVVSEYLSEVQTYQALIPFGMKLMDNEVGLDLSKLKNPKLRVDVSLTAVRATGATGFVSGTGRLSCVLILNDGADMPSPATYLKSAEIKKWTTAASGDEVTNPPMDGPWARLIVRAFKAGSNPDDILTDLKVDFDAGQSVPIDELTKLAADSSGLFLGDVPRFQASVFAKDTETYTTRHGGLEQVKAQALVDTNVACVAAFEDGQVTFNLNVLGAGTTQATEDQIWLDFAANHPYSCMFWDFVPQGMLPVSGFTRGQVTLTQGVVSGAASIVLQQLMENREAA
jgi:hypothetical protein